LADGSGGAKLKMHLVMVFLLAESQGGPETEERERKKEICSLSLLL
jgi:hypothetical protein